jgi:hypothetical protein
MRNITTRNNRRIQRLMDYLALPVDHLEIRQRIRLRRQTCQYRTLIADQGIA